MYKPNVSCATIIKELKLKLYNKWPANYVCLLFRMNNSNVETLLKDNIVKIWTFKAGI